MQKQLLPFFFVTIVWVQPDPCYEKEEIFFKPFRPFFSNVTEWTAFTNYLTLWFTCHLMLIFFSWHWVNLFSSFFFSFLWLFMLIYKESVNTFKLAGDTWLTSTHANTRCGIVFNLSMSTLTFVKSNFG